MGRLALIAACAALFISPRVRERMAPYAHWVLDPAYEWAVGSKLGDIANAVEGEAAQNRAVPTTSGGLHQFLRAYYHREEATLDPWEHPFYMVRDERGLHVASAGRDGVQHTADDLLSRPLDLSTP